jgi:hypothetical protein
VSALAALPALYRNEDVFTIDSNGLTVSLLVRDGAMAGKSVVMPGFDHLGRAGWMLFEPGHVPYFTQAGTVGAALDERKLRHIHRCKLHETFEAEAGLEHAVANVPGRTWIKFDTIMGSRRGAWEAEAALRRVGLWWMAKKAGGLPACVLQRCGKVGRYAIANFLLLKRFPELVARPVISPPPAEIGTRIALPTQSRSVIRAAEKPGRPERWPTKPLAHSLGRRAAKTRRFSARASA